MSLTGLKAYNGQLEFYNVDELETMATAEHFMATDIDWDPTGRQVLDLFLFLFRKSCCAAVLLETNIFYLDKLEFPEIFLVVDVL